MEEEEERVSSEQATKLIYNDQKNPILKGREGNLFDHQCFLTDFK